MNAVNRQSNFQPQRFSITPRRPVKQRVYPAVKHEDKSVTVCIAAIHGVDSFDPKIITCTDGRLDYGEFGSGSSADKFRLLGYNWFALLSGDWNEAGELATFLSEEIQAQPPSKSRREILTLVRKACEDFIGTPFFSQTMSCDLIIGGFINRLPMLISAGVRNESSYAHVTGDTAIIGSGATIAQTILNLRDYSRRLDLREAAYLIYEAKRTSQKVVSVGPETWFEIHRPTTKPAPKEGATNVQWAKEELFVKLEEQYQKLCLQPITLEDLPDLPRPIDAPLLPPPSPESSEGSGES